MKYLFFLLTILFCGLQLNAQDVKYPTQKLMSQGNYALAETEIKTALAADADDCLYNFCAYKLYSDENFSGKNQDLAYDYLVRAKVSYAKTKDKSKLSKAKLSPSIINRLVVKYSQIALDNALQANTLDACQQFLSKYIYANDNQKKTAIDRITVLNIQKSFVQNWDSLKYYQNTYKNSPEFVSVIQDSMYQMLKKDPVIDRIKWSYINFKSPELRDSAMLLLHKVYENAGVYNFSDFWSQYSYKNYPEIKAKDDLVNETYKTGNKLKLAIDGAQYRVGYDALLDLVKMRINSNDYEGAIYKLNSFADYYGDDYYFNTLKKMLLAPMDESIVVKKYSKDSDTKIQLIDSDTTYSSDGNAVIFSMKMKNSSEIMPSKNLFIKVRDRFGNFGPAFEIGNPVNSPGDETTPFLHPDMKTLYFASNGHNNIGGSDIFMSTRLNEDSWTEWSEPVNIGKEFNTAYNESNFKITNDGTIAYFSRLVDNVITWYYVETPQNIKPEAVTAISGKVTDNYGKPVKVKISWEDLETRKLIGWAETKSNGTYTIVLPEGKNYGYFINNDLFFPVSSNVDLRDVHEFKELKNDITIVKIEDMVNKQIPIVLNNLFFEAGKSELLPASLTELQRVYNILVEKKLKVEISGHTDNSGDDAVNQLLSEARAKAVKDYLVELGYDSGLLVTIGYGKKKPIANNDTPEGRQKNRRVELRVLKK
ncbi:MAG: OmpA family protein [Bacteroidales bacterium]|nr:OmpA family protein [Bacteroidales bacterium]